MCTEKQGVENVLVNVTRMIVTGFWNGVIVYDYHEKTIVLLKIQLIKTVQDKEFYC